MTATVILVLLCSACAKESTKSEQAPVPDPTIETVKEFTRWKSQAEQLASRIKASHTPGSGKYEKTYLLYLDAKSAVDSSIKGMQKEILLNGKASSAVGDSKKSVDEYLSYTKSLFIRIDDQMGFGIDDIVEGAITGMADAYIRIDKHLTLAEEEKRQKKAALFNDLKWEDFLAVPTGQSK